MKRRPIVRFFQVASLLMVLVAVALLAAIVTMHFAIHGAEVKIPALKGMTVADARSQTAGLGLNLDVDNRYYSAEVAAGHILTQSPSAGTVVRREWRVRVSESLGPQQVDVPNTVGIEDRMAALELQRAGLEVSGTIHLADADAPANSVLAQDPPAHAKDIAGPSVSLLVAAPDNEAPDGYVMPDFTGLPIVTAQMQLEKVGIKTATPNYAEGPIQVAGSAVIGPGSVVAQSPVSGARVDETTLVKLTVAK